jgi:hypothetical protein
LAERDRIGIQGGEAEPYQVASVSKPERIMSAEIQMVVFGSVLNERQHLREKALHKTAVRHI